MSSLRAPARLLLDRRLPGTAKLLWLIWQLSDPGDRSIARLHERSGLARQTIKRCLACLDSVGWLTATPPCRNSDPSGHVSLPIALVQDKVLGVQAKLTYGALQLLPSVHGGSGQFTYAALSDLTGLTLMPVRAAVRELERRGWLQTTQQTKFSPIHFTLCHPMRFGDVALVERRLAEANFQGEAIMQEYLSLIVESDEFEENARPGFLVNPYTDERMEFDRYYPPKVAFEFNGDQHYGPTERFPNEADAWRQQGRDLMKIGICVRRSITLVTIHGEDLSLEVMRQKVEGLLPLRDLTGLEPLITLLEEAGRGYRRGRRHRRTSNQD